MNIRSPATFLVLSFFLVGCSSIIEGTTQQILIKTNPTKAQCTLTRNEKTIATIAETPQYVLVKKTKDRITVSCSLKNGQAGKTELKSEASAVAFSNIVTNLGFGWIFDTISGADNKYESEITIPLVQQPN